MTQIVSFKADNFKRLQAVEVVPDPWSNSVIVAGKNAQGKSSILEGIFATLGGRAGVDKKKTPQPIREGERKAEVSVALSNGLTVTRKWAGERVTLEVKGEDGSKFASADKVLAELRGALSFDPLAFAEAEPKKQRETLLGLVELPFDPDANEAARKRAYDDRTEVNREVKRLEGALDTLPSVPPGTPDAEVSVAELVKRRGDVAAERGRREALRAEWSAAKLRIDHLEREIAELRERQTQIGVEADALTLESSGTNLETLDEQLAGVDETNRHVRVKHQRADLTEDLVRAQEESAELTATIDEMVLQREDGLKVAIFPLEGLGFDEDGVTYQGVPFAQASSAERIRVSTAIAMAMNPELRVILIEDASLLDSDALAAIDELAAEKGYQIWLEMVGDDVEGATVVIEDGMVKA